MTDIDGERPQFVQLIEEHHGFVAESRYETAGQVNLGVEPEFALVAF